MKMSLVEHTVIGMIVLAIILAAFLWVARDKLRYRRLVAVTIAMTFLLVILGAFVRLSDAGLGCPDWPGCYGNFTPHHSVDSIRAAETLQPGGPVTMAKAWKEMVHRYLAMVVGALIAAISFAAWRNRRAWDQSPALASIIALAVVFQAALGAWTVTMLLKPAIVTSHLLGGVAILSLLVWLYWRQFARSASAPSWAKGIISSGALRIHGLAALIAILLQIMLGGWVSTNYAALACTDFPLCNGEILPAMDFANAFHIIRPLGMGPDGELLKLEALRAIQWTHRLGAVIVVLIVGSFALSLLKLQSGRKAAKMLMGLVVLQLSLGVSNVWFSLPIWIAVAHNGMAAILFAQLMLVNLRLLPQRN